MTSAFSGLWTSKSKISATNMTIAEKTPREIAQHILSGSFPVTRTLMFHDAELGIQVVSRSGKGFNIEAKVAEYDKKIAQEAGWKDGDRLKKIHGEDVDDWNLQQINSKLAKLVGAKENRPIQLVIERECPAFSITCDRKKKDPKSLSKWVKSVIVLNKGKIIRYSDIDQKEIKEEFGLLWDSKVVEMKGTKPNKVGIYVHEGIEQAQYSFLDTSVMQKVIERIEDAISGAAESNVPVPLIFAAQFRDEMKVGDVVEGLMEGHYELGKVVSRGSDAADVQFQGGIEKSVPLTEIRQPHTCITAEQIESTFKQSKKQREEKVTNPKRKSMRRTYSYKEEVFSGWINKAKACQIDAILEDDGTEAKALTLRMKLGGDKVYKVCVTAGNYLALYLDGMELSSDQARVASGEEKKRRADQLYGAFDLTKVKDIKSDKYLGTLSFCDQHGAIVNFKGSDEDSVEAWEKDLNSYKAYLEQLKAVGDNATITQIPTPLDVTQARADSAPDAAAADSAPDAAAADSAPAADIDAEKQSETSSGAAETKAEESGAAAAQTTTEGEDAASGVPPGLSHAVEAAQASAQVAMAGTADHTIDLPATKEASKEDGGDGTGTAGGASRSGAGAEKSNDRDMTKKPSSGRNCCGFF